MPPARTFTRPFLPGRAPFTLYDIPVAFGLLALLWAFVRVGQGMTEPVLPESATIDLGFEFLPYYALRSTARMFIGYIWSLAFTFIAGPLMVHSRRAEKILLPVIDILQSVPVLGFLAISVNGFMALFPGSTLGIELAAIFAIFTSMAWNMAYSYYQSVRVIPRDLRESAAIFGLGPVQRFVRLEVPFAMTGLVWNSMVSFGVGWFFLAASEAIAVLGKDVRLPGVGSYLATAVEAGDFGAIGAVIVVTLGLVALLDVLFFRPLLAWAQKFQSGGALADEFDSAVLTALQRSGLVESFQETVARPVASFLVDRLPALLRRGRPAIRELGRGPALSWTGWGLTIVGLVVLAIWGVRASASVIEGLDGADVLEIGLSGLATFARVTATVIAASLLWVPIGTYIGSRPALARRIRPIIQIGAAFPSNLLFPILIIAFAKAGIGIGFGSVILLFVATQWYILFNVIVGALSVPPDLREVSRMLQLSRWQRFRHLTGPVVFPYWVTGALTAAGGAWNASVVSEVVRLGDHRAECFGLGAYIAQATFDGHWPRIVASIAWMCFLVVLTNRLLWQRLYRYAEEHLQLDA